MEEISQRLGLGDVTQEKGDQRNIMKMFIKMRATTIEQEASKGKKTMKQAIYDLKDRNFENATYIRMEAIKA